MKYILIIFLLVNFISCSQDKGNFKSMTTDQLKEELKNNSDIVILDVRNPEELKGPLGQIKNVINIPVDQLAQRVKELDKHKDKKIAVICRSGARSRVASGILTQQGFNAVNVEGGMISFNN